MNFIYLLKTYCWVSLILLLHDINRRLAFIWNFYRLQNYSCYTCFRYRNYRITLICTDQIIENLVGPIPFHTFIRRDLRFIVNIAFRKIMYFLNEKLSPLKTRKFFGQLSNSSLKREILRINRRIWEVKKHFLNFLYRYS